MKQYRIKTIEDASEIVKAEKLLISEYKFGTPGYEPQTSAKLVYVKGKGFLCQMESEETNLRAKVTEIDGDTYLDSCLEFFINFDPKSGDEYLNLEGNPIGTLHCKFGKDRHVRKPLSDYGCYTRPDIKVLHPEKGWGLEFFISIETIRALYHRDLFIKGDVLRGNFFKCGDLTIHPHFGMWNKIELAEIDFHRPDFFGQFVID